MSLLDRPFDRLSIDLERWPDLARPDAVPVRATIARALLRHIARRAGIRVEVSDGRAYGPLGAPVMSVCDPDAFFARLGASGKIGFGESYMAREWESEDLIGVLVALARRPEALVPRPLQVVRRWYEARRPEREDNDRDGSIRNIGSHYDLSNDLFATFLDETMSYSSAYFLDPSDSLAQAQAYKIERLLDATGVRENSRVLEVGTGWGELALRAARRGARVTSVTVSKEQAALARQRVAAAGLDALVEIRIEDYRDVGGLYDAVLSVEMIEAVGERWWPTYFRALDERLAPGGRLGLQSILMSHDRLQSTKRSWTWIHKYIFPGGIIPSEEAIHKSVRNHTGLVMVDGIRFGASYAATLRAWRTRFLDAAPQVANLGFDATFRRMWEFYLAYCESGFESGYLDVGQFVFDKAPRTSRIVTTDPSQIKASRDG
jgi:cyclopropane-fatty-acyl-phospholipid synthase